VPEAKRDPDVLFTPALPALPPLVRTPILQGSAALPGYYGTTTPMIIRAPITAAPCRLSGSPAICLRRLRLLLKSERSAGYLAFARQAAVRWATG